MCRDLPHSGSVVLRCRWPADVLSGRGTCLPMLTSASLCRSPRSPVADCPLWTVKWIFGVHRDGLDDRRERLGYTLAVAHEGSDQPRIGKSCTVSPVATRWTSSSGG